MRMLFLCLLLLLALPTAANAQTSAEGVADCIQECSQQCQKQFETIVDASRREQVLKACIARCQQRCRAGYELYRSKQGDVGFYPQAPTAIEGSTKDQIRGPVTADRSDKDEALTAILLYVASAFGFVFYYYDRPADEPQLQRFQRLHGELHAKGGYNLTKNAQILGDISLDFRNIGIDFETSYSPNSDPNDELTVVQTGLHLMARPRLHNQPGVGIGFLHVDQGGNGLSGGYFSLINRFTVSEELWLRFAPLLGILEEDEFYVGAKFDITCYLTKHLGPTFGLQFHVFDDRIFFAPVAGLGIRF